LLDEKRLRDSEIEAFKKDDPLKSN
jgi:hypothetical protein